MNAALESVDLEITALIGCSSRGKWSREYYYREYSYCCRNYCYWNTAIEDIETTSREYCQSPAFGVLFWRELHLEYCYREFCCREYFSREHCSREFCCREYCYWNTAAVSTTTEVLLLEYCSRGNCYEKFLHPDRCSPPTQQSKSHQIKKNLGGGGPRL